MVESIDGNRDLSEKRQSFSGEKQKQKTKC